MVDLFRRRTLERAYLEMLALIPDGYAPSPEQRQSLLESLQQIDAMLDGLGPKVKQAFLLSQLEGLGYADIAVRLGVSISSVKNTWPRPPSIACCSAWKTTFSHEQRHHPEQRQALKMAAHWYALLCDEHVTDRQRQQWQAWHQQHDDHRWAWQRVEALQSQLQGVPGKFSYRALDRAGRQSAIDRRTLLKSLLLLLGVGGSGFLYQSPLGRELRADYRTATGEIKPIVLSDGTQLVLNTASAVDVHYDDRQRLIRLHAGEISLVTGRDPGRCGCKARRERCARSAPAFGA